jgi:hypothetical protein
MPAFRPMLPNPAVLAQAPVMAPWQAQQMAMHQADFQHIWIGR